MSAEPIDLEPRDLTPLELDRIEAANNPPTTSRPHGTADLTLPTDPDAENELTGAAITIPGAAAHIRNLGITPHHITNPGTRRILQTALDLDEAGDDPTEPTSIAHALKDEWERTDGHKTHAQLTTAAVSSTKAIAARATRLHQAHTLRLQVAAIETARTAAAQGDTRAFHQALDHLDETRRTTHTPTTTTWDDVAAAMRGTIERTQPDHLIRTDGTALIYPGRLHWLMGEPGKGKTWVALHAAHQLLEVDIGHVIYLDWENSRDLIADRLTTLGAHPDRVEHQLRYTRSPSLDPTWIAALADSIEDGPNTLIVVDGAAPSITSGGWNEDKAADVLAWLDRLVWPLTNTGAAVLVLDHVTKDRETRGLWPRGSGAKAGAVDGAAWLYRVRKPFSRLTAGHADLIQAKDREGVNGEDGHPVATFHATPTPNGRTLFELRPPTTTTTETGVFRPTVLMERLSRHIENENRYDRHPTRSELVGGKGPAQVKGKKQHLIAALDVLLDEGWVTATPGGRSHQHTSERPYRETTDTPPGEKTPPQDDEF